MSQLRWIVQFVKFDLVNYLWILLSLLVWQFNQLVKISKTGKTCKNYKNSFHWLDLSKWLNYLKVIQGTKCITNLTCSTRQSFQSSLIGWPGWIIKLAKTVKLQKFHDLHWMVEVVYTVKLSERFNWTKCVTSLNGFTAQPTLISSTS